MSHQPERLEKNCLNCGTIVAGRYCQHCGQENLETRESFWSLFRHFIFDILHFDGNFFSTTRYLFTRPGFVARQYAEGRRSSYLHPIRMYLFTSAIFFLLFFSISGVPEIKEAGEVGNLRPEKRARLIRELREDLAGDLADTSLQGRIARLSDTTRPVLLSDIDPGSGRFFYDEKTKYTSADQYDSIQKTLPSNKRDGWFSRILTRRGLTIDEKYKDRKGHAGQTLIEHFYHHLPYVFFFSLPFFALILKLLYVRRRNFYYSDHAIFTLYHYIFSFMLLMAALLISGLNSLTGWSWLGFLMLFIFLAGPVYLYLEMKQFYRQGVLKTLGKFILLNMLAGIVIILLFVLFFFFSIFQL